MFNVYLRVVSNVLSLDALVESLGANDYSRRSGVGSQSAEWRRTLWEEQPVWPEDLWANLSSDPTLAARIGGLVSRELASGFLVIVQRVTDVDDQQQKGIWLDAKDVGWLASAQLGIDIDQYLSSE